MSQWTRQATHTLALRAVQVATFPLMPRHLRAERKRMLARLDQPEPEGDTLPPVTAAGGAFCTHSTVSALDEFALCGAPVWSWGGGYAEVDCPACRLLWPPKVKAAIKAHRDERAKRLDDFIAARQAAEDAEEWDDEIPDLDIDLIRTLQQDEKGKKEQ